MSADAFLEAETAPEEERETKARTHLIRPNTPPTRTDGLNGMDGRVEEDDEFGMNEEEAQKKQHA